MKKREAAKKISGHIVGPMPIKRFLDEFMPGSFTSEKSPNRDRFKKFRESKSEKKMYARWMKALEDICQPENGIVLVNTHNDKISYEEKHNQKFGPDVTAFCVHNVNSEVPTKGNLERAEVLMEFKFNSTEDPFNDKGCSFERTHKHARGTLGQIAMSATAHLSAQFRTHVFSLLVFPKYVRILRWDRSGVVVSEKISLYDGDEIVTFFKRYGEASPAVRGVDTTVEPHGLDPTQEAEARTRLNAGIDVPLRRIFVGTRYLIIGTSTFLPDSSIFGRATRCHRAYDPEAASQGEESVFFLKDTWRIWTKNRLNEYEVLVYLHSKGVEYIPAVECGGDVDDETDTNHKTRTQGYCLESWNRGTRVLRGFRHFRLVTEKLDLHLHECEAVEEAVMVVRDASLGHGQAHEKAGVDHRDISWANIMAKRLKNGKLRGYLIDWDMYKFVKNNPNSLEKYDELSGRTGTWPWMAARLLDVDGVPPEQNRVDDVESFFHILVYLASMYTKHALSGSQLLTHFIKDYFEEALLFHGRMVGGTHKIIFMRLKGSRLSPHLRIVPFRRLLRSMAEVLGLRYVVGDVDSSGEEMQPALSQLEKEGLDDLDTNVFWFPDFVKRALELDGWDPEIHKIVTQELPPLENRWHFNRSSSSESTSTTSRQTASESDEGSRDEREEALKEGRILDRDGHTSKKQKRG